VILWTGDGGRETGVRLLDYKINADVFKRRLRFSRFAINGLKRFRFSDRYHCLFKKC